MELDNRSGKQHHGPVTLAGTAEWRCSKSRTADLGAFDIASGTNRLTITSKGPSGARIYSLWLVRLPSSPASESGAFSFDDFSVSANRIGFRSHQSRDGFVLLNEIYYPGWKATIDGNPAEILPADGIFRGLFVPAGSHRLELWFWPRHFAWGAAISLLTLAAYVTYAALNRRQQASRKTILEPTLAAR